MALPNGRSDTIAFFARRLPAWLADYAAIGLSLADVQEVQTLVQQAQADALEAERARLAARAATLRLHLSADALREKGRRAVERILLTAAASGDPAILPTAEVEGPRSPRRLGPPGRPTGFRQKLSSDGTVTLTWKSTNSKPSTGAMFTLSRQVTRAGPGGQPSVETGFELIGAVPARTFTDTTLPAGAAEVVYRVQGRRGGELGEAAMFTVRFGVSEWTASARSGTMAA